MDENQGQTNRLPESLNLWQQTLHWQPDSEQLAQFQQLYELVLAGNRQLNLTRITEPHDFWEKHLWDSLRGIRFSLDSQKANLQVGGPAHPLLSPSTSVIDIGTGAGFPGLPVAIAHPTWSMTLLDSTQKKIAFLEATQSQLQLNLVKPLTDRAEQLGHHPQHRQAYDLALVRAVASASACAEYALPLLKLGGIAVLYRGQWSEPEAAALSVALGQLGGRLQWIEDYRTPLTQGVRHCLYLQKIRPTPAQFPRPAGVPARHPL